MDILTAYAVYMTGAILFVGMFAVRVPYENIRTVFALALMWPLSFLVILTMVLMNFTGWNVDAAQGTKMFGFRRPTHAGVHGFAISICYGEVQFWKAKKVDK